MALVLAWTRVGADPQGAASQPDSPQQTTETATATATATNGAATVTPTATGPTATATPRWRALLPYVARVAPGAPATGSFLYVFGRPSPSSVTLAWRAVAEADGYILWRSATANFANPTVVYRGAGAEATVSLSVGANYFRVEAVNQWGSSFGNTVEVSFEGINLAEVLPLVWASNHTGNWDIWIQDTAGIRNLTANLGEGTRSNEIDPVISPRGDFLAFASNLMLPNNNCMEIYRAPLTRAANGAITLGNHERVTESFTGVNCGGQTSVNPAWSPDGNAIALTSDAGTFRSLDIYRVNVTGTLPVRLTDDWDIRLTWPTLPGEPTVGPPTLTPTVTPTSTAYVAPSPTPTPTVTYYDNYIRLSTSRQPSFSPDGRYITFTSNRTGTDEVYIMLSSGHNQRRLTYTVSNNIWPRWSPSGERIAFVSNRDGNWELYTMRPDGTGETRITSNLAVDSQPTWTRNSAFLGFVSTREGALKLFVVTADGRTVQKISELQGHQYYAPSWSP